MEMSEPREGLPPCKSLARFDGRRASMIDTALCDGSHYFHKETGKRLFIVIGIEGATSELDPHGFLEHWFNSWVLQLLTDDPDEAQAAFDKGAEYVRTGVMP